MYAIILLAVSLSFDAFGLGISYGINGTKISIVPKLLICFLSISVSFIGIMLGVWLANSFGLTIGKWLGIFILICIGSWMIINSLKSGSVKSPQKIINMNEPRKIATFVIKSLGLTIMVVKNPSTADVDNSGEIDIFEALMLGIAINVDAFFACIGCVMSGCANNFIPFAIGFAQLAFLQFGLWNGEKIGLQLGKNFISFVPGSVLIIFALISIFINY